MRARAPANDRSWNTDLRELLTIAPWDGSRTTPSSAIATRWPLSAATRRSTGGARGASMRRRCSAAFSIPTPATARSPSTTDVHRCRTYVPDTNVLTTVLSATTATSRSPTACRSPRSIPHIPPRVTTSACILRRLRCLSGEVEAIVDIVIKPDYARPSRTRAGR